MRPELRKASSRPGLREAGGRLGLREAGGLREDGSRPSLREAGSSPGLREAGSRELFSQTGLGVTSTEGAKRFPTVPLYTQWRIFLHSRPGRIQ